jgi:hypothetical protein
MWAESLVLKFEINERPTSLALDTNLPFSGDVDSHTMHPLTIGTTITTLLMASVAKTGNCYAFVALQNRRQSIRVSISRGSAAVVVSASKNIDDTIDTTGSTKQDFWDQQKELALELSSKSAKSFKQVQSEKFEARRLALVYDTAQFAVYIFCGCWLFFPNPFTAFSYAFGATMGLAYAFGLGKSVETMGQSIDDVQQGSGGAGVGEARFAFLILLFILVGKFRGEMGLQEIPSIAGFFTYQIASLNQGLREIND